IKSVAIIEVHTSSGIIGIGETSAGIYAPDLIAPLAELISTLIEGFDPLEIDYITKSLNIPFIGGVGLFRSVVSAVEIALWDIKGQVENKPIYELLSSTHSDDVKVYASAGSVALDSDQISNDVERALNRGFDSYKMRIGRKQWSRDIDRVEAARTMLGNNNLMVDAIMGTLQSWSENEAIEKTNELKEFNPTWVEEPLHPLNVSGYKNIYHHCNVPIAVGEGLSSKSEFDSFLDGTKCIDIIQPDVTHCGFLVARDVITKAKAKEIGVAVHVWGSGISLLANLHLSLAMKAARFSSSRRSFSSSCFSSCFS
ncbi:hypothetical protein LCGC14_2344580, partial [marine sediment metagenome]